MTRGVYLTLEIEIDHETFTLEVECQSEKEFEIFDIRTTGNILDYLSGTAYQDFMARIEDMVAEEMKPQTKSEWLADQEREVA